ncbi:cardiolipin synthase B [Ktedonobacter sp. SOSP1-52]|uniref:phospholipase D-like domain-containing protein n=1 Tax=Ktedonobacter sp. SOSP1-52 TaxID=2778366 RepID=UPI001914F3C9|nr:phospholipase D-like domain-containing protein [Ktedonobacter sp. SOSP1-52]GHO68581.1 cardiolipin synthase B [Ktedonobacter sp. SOSP1-52]
MPTPEHIPRLTSRQARFSLSCLLCWLLMAIFAPAFVVSMILLVVDQRRKQARPQGHLTRIPTSPVYVVNSEIKLYTYGEDLYADMLASIEGARKHIFIETFIWKGDAVGRQFRDALGRAAARGIEVYVIYDSFANLVVPRAFFASFAPQIHMLAYPFLTLPFNPLSLASYARDHRKILVVDSRVAFLGGYNIGSLYATHWRDTHARIIGHDAWEVEATFVDFWNTHRTRDLPRLAASAKRDWDPYIQFFRNEPSVLTFPIRASYYEVIDRARKRIYLTQAYFIPNRFFIRLLFKAAERGVDVRILLPAISNHVIADWLGRAFYTTCLKAGIRLFLYQDAMVHAKTATIDGIWSTVGTANIDRLSMLGNYEINLAIYNRELATQMETIFHNDTTHARELSLVEWESRPRLHKYAEYLLRPLRPFL